MTLNDIIVSALAQLDRGHDSQTIDAWRSKFTRFANEAVTDIATALQLSRSETTVVSGGVIDVRTLSKQCVKVLYVTRQSTRLPFTFDIGSNEIVVTAPDGNVEVHYRFLPDDMENPTDKPELPSFCHGLIVTYVVARERASQDASSQRGANVYFELYNAGKRGLKASIGDGGSGKKIINKW